MRFLVNFQGLMKAICLLWNLHQVHIKTWYIFFGAYCIGCKNFPFFVNKKSQSEMHWSLNIFYYLRAADVKTASQTEQSQACCSHLIPINNGMIRCYTFMNWDKFCPFWKVENTGVLGLHEYYNLGISKPLHSLDIICYNYNSSTIFQQHVNTSFG